MKRKYYYPGDFALRAEWHTNLAAKLLQYGAAPLALQTADINNGVADNLYMAYGLRDWITNVREYAPACTSALKVLARGSLGMRSSSHITVFALSSRERRVPCLPTVMSSRR